MRVLAKRTLQDFWLLHPDAEESLLAWYREAEEADWDQPAAVKAQYRSCSILKNRRVVFNIKGNAYRLVAKINYEHRVIYIRFVGTHSDYDAIDVDEV
ncbi:toxin RelE [Bradyrhizobium sp. CCBAU 65884]|nr:toxin RelE [Bradyrhizobium sp. CCBAU 65884]